MLRLQILCLVALSVLANNVELDENFIMEWSVLTGRMHQRPKCVDIPDNMTLCHGIGYNRMRLPNLLEHDALQEATTQANNWKPLLGIRCNPNTQIFLCSLFSPICLERVVYPCRSLCESVKDSCEGYMKDYGFLWPEMFRCDKFPTDDSLCVPAPTQQGGVDDRICKPCKEPDTYEGILHNYCRSNYVVRAKVRGLVKNSTTAALGEIEVNMGKGSKKFYKRDQNARKSIYKALRSGGAKIYIDQAIGCTCDSRIVKGEHHLIGVRTVQRYDTDGNKVTHFYADFITPWREKTNSGKSTTKKSVKKALRIIRKNDDICLGGLFTLNMDDIAIKPNRQRDHSNRRGGRRSRV